MRLKPIVTACVLAGIALLLYGFRLGAAPLTSEESGFNQQALSIRIGATPLFFHVQGEAWLQPAAVYANAAMAALGGDDVSGRAASAIAGAINVALVFLITHLITGRQWAGVIAALILLLTPAHWSLAQRGTDAIVPVPFILLWLWSVLRFFRHDVGLLPAAAALGVSTYSHPAAPLTAAFLWALTLAVARRRNRVRLVVATLVFGAAWVPAAGWFFRYPDTYADTFGRWFVFAAHLRRPLDGLSAFVNTNTLGNRAGLYWEFWNPAWLFAGTPDSAAPLLLVTAPLIALGGVYCARKMVREMALLVLGAALAVPLAGATFGASYYISSAAAVLPVLAVLSALGVDFLVGLVARRRSLEDDVDVGAVDGWHADDALPRR